MTRFKDLKVGAVLSETTFYKLEKIVGDRAELKTNDGQDVVLDKGYIEGILVSGDQFDKEEKVTRTELAAILLKNSGVVFTANFNKQVKEGDVVKEVMEAYENSTPKTMEAAVKKAVKKGSEGEPRTLRGFHYGVQDEYGRIQSYDLDVTGHQLRLIDPRTINWIIARRIKYSVK